MSQPEDDASMTNELRSMALSMTLPAGPNEVFTDPAAAGLVGQRTVVTVDGQRLGAVVQGTELTDDGRSLTVHLVVDGGPGEEAA